MKNQGPYFVVVCDRHSKTFSVEGPVDDDNAWSATVAAANTSGGDYGCDAIALSRMSAQAIVEEWKQMGFKLVEKGSILKRLG